MAIEHKEISPGCYISTGDSMEELMDDMAQRTDEANKHLKPEQRGLINSKRDQYYVNTRCLPDLLIFGIAYSLESSKKLELKAYRVEKVEDLDVDDQKSFLWSMKSMEENRNRGYIFGRAYSVACPEGELGDTHAFDMWPISKEAYEEAEKQNWQPAINVDESPKLHRELQLMAAEFAPTK